MAEFLAIIGGVAASAEITKSLIAVKRLCSTVRDADQELQYLLKEVENVNNLLQAVETLQIQLLPFVTRQPEMEASQKLCQEVAGELTQIILDLRRRIEASRSLGSVRYAMKEVRILTLGAKLDRAKNNVLLAQQIVHGVLQYQQILRTIDLQKMISHVQDQLQRPSETQMYALSQSEQNEESSLCHSTEKRCQRQDSIVVLSPSQALVVSRQLRVFSYVLQFYARLCSGNWTFNFRTYYTVPADALISQLCTIGDLNAIRKLMAEDCSLISARIEPWGMTPLQVAISQGQVDVARFLIQQGSDLDEYTLRPCHNIGGAPWSCFRIFSYFCDLDFRNKIWKMKRSEMLYLLAQENFCYDLTGDDAAQSIYQWLEWTVCIPEEDGIDIVKRSVYPPYESTTLHQRLQWACVSAKIRPTKFWKVLGQETFDEACVELALKHYYCNPLPRILDGLGESISIIGKGKDLRLGCRHSPSRQVWLNDLSRIIRGPGMRLLFHSRASYEFGRCKTKRRGTTYLEAFLGSLYPWSGCSPEALPVLYDEAVRYFAELLLDAGISHSELESLGKCFHVNSVGNSISWQFLHMWRNRFWLAGVHIRIVGFEFGSVAHKWKIYISLPFDETLSDFWCLIEDSDVTVQDSSALEELYIPGAWIEEDDFCYPPTEPLRTYHNQILSDASLSRRRRQRYLRYHGISNREHDNVFRFNDLRQAGWAEKLDWRHNIAARKRYYGAERS